MSRQQKIDYEVRNLVSGAQQSMQSIADNIRKYEQIVKSGDDHNGNALANLRYYSRRLQELNSSRIQSSG